MIYPIERICAEAIRQAAMHPHDTPEQVQQHVASELGIDAWLVRDALGQAKKLPEGHHQFDDDGVCERCDFDGAEWHWWKNSTYEGRAQPEAKLPICTGA